ncbi:MAG: phenylalanine--tRNA ligase subunit alpha [Candidatus Pacearchaeota archaeon]
MNVKETVESLSPIEKKVAPLLKNNSFEEIIKKSGLERVAVLRALEFLNSKKIIKLKLGKKQVVNLDKNGEIYLKELLPERRLLKILSENKDSKSNSLSLDKAKYISKLSEEEFKVALGSLKKKALIEIKENEIILIANEKETEKKFLEEILIENLPLELEKLTPEQKFAVNSLKPRKQIIKIREVQTVNFEITDIGELVLSELPKLKEDLIEHLTPEIIASKSWKGKKFRRYDVISKVPEIHGGKRHFVNQTIEYARRVWTEMGFKEMTGNLVVSSFWNFDALFTAQDHPVREMQDTFFINEKEKFIERDIVERVKSSHEKGVDNSVGWNYKWDEELSKKMLLRTHTTCISAQTLARIKSLNLKLPQKFFAIGKCFRNETLDWKHGFEFNQTEGIVVDKNANFSHLLGYLKEFFKKMGFDKIRFRPSYFPYTEPSVEIEVFHSERRVWLELGGAGIFRPEVTIPLLGERVPVLAWGPGFDRMLMDYYEIKDLRELYSNNLKSLRNKRLWIK